MWRNAGDYVKRWGAALIRGAATNAEFTVGAFWAKMIKFASTIMQNVNDSCLLAQNFPNVPEAADQLFP